ncbi:DUF4832 domain-containing protein [Cohnella sp. GCM10027633]|uniref:DUF4832 domain-containing protein n=1 Tax=unclassified Cohnella TaxID=2636738 RepID=UPI0036387564
MFKKKLVSATLAAIILIGLLPAYTASAATLTYSADLATAFANPERGFHNRYEIINDVSVNDYASSATSIAGFNPDMLDRTFARAKQAGNTLIHSYLHLDKFKNVDQLPQALLDNLDSGLDAIRDAGLKIVLRPAYAWSESPQLPESRILGHIAQINAVITANADVVLHLETGYLGPWGEWHTSQFTDAFNRESADTRYRIVKKILDTTPISIPIVVRYPIFIKEILELPTPSGTTALTQSDRDRIGFHNDCFLSDTADMGTYDNNSWMGWFYVEEKKQWMYDLATSAGGNKMMGGETCDSAGSNDLAGVNVQSEMSKLNFTEINEDFAAVNINIWKNANLAASGNDPAETAFARLERKLGYRLRLVDATFPTSGSPGGTFAFSAHLNNDGYSGIVKSRPAFLVFDGGTQRYNVPLNGVDVRQWLAGAVTVGNQTVTLPSAMAGGTYKLALWLPDANEGLRARPEYSVRFANAGTWDAVKGYNVLANAVTISGTPVAPQAPTNVQASPGSTQVALTWDAVDGATSYSVLRSTTSGSGYAQVATGITGTSYTNTGLTNGTTYYYVVRAVNSVGASGNSPQASATPAAISAPAAPASLTATAGNGSASLSWPASTGATSYAVLRSTTSGSGYAQVASGVTGTSYADTGLTNGTAYYYVVRATNGGGTSGNSPQASATPAAPQPVTIDSFASATALSNKKNDLNQDSSWTMDSLYYGSDSTGNIVINSGGNGQYLQENVNRSLAGASNLIIRVRDWSDSDSENHWNVVLNDGTDHTVGPISTYGNVTGSYTNISIPLSAFNANLANTQYVRIVHRDSSYAVLLVDSITVDGGGSGGGGDTVAPSAPAALASSGVTTNSISLTWSASTDNVGVTGYTVFRGATQVGTPTGTSFTDTGLSAGTAYSYTVKARDAAGNLSAASSALSVTTSAASDTTAPSAPSNLASPSKTSSSVNLTWSASTDNVGVTGYAVFRGATQVGTPTGTSYSDTGLSAATAYVYTVKARDAAGNWSAASSAQSVTTDAATAQTSYEAEASGNTLVGNAATASCGTCSGGSKVGYVGNGATLQWNGVVPATAGSQTVKFYYLNGESSRSAQVSVNGGTAVTVNFPSSGGWTTVASLDVTLTLAAGANAIKVSNAGGWAPDFDRISLSAPPDTQAPAAPTGLASPAKTSVSVDLTWNAATDNVGVAGYQVFRGATQVGTPSSTSFTDTGLTAGTAYSYSVRARDAAGNVSAASSALSVTTTPPDTQAPSVPSGLAVASKTSGSVNLTWNASTDNTGVTGYQVFRGSTQVGTPSGTSFTDTGLSASTAYSYTVRARDAAGNVSAASSALSVTTNAPPPGGSATTVPTGVPVNPYTVNTPDSALAVHALTKGADPITNPLKGFAIWHWASDNADKTVISGGIRNSLEWKYFGLGEVMTGMNAYNWDMVEKVLDEVASHGKQVAIRIASCESFSSKDVPDFLMSEVRNGCILNYDSPTVMQAFQNFIAAFGAKYDGDPRIGFIHQGLIGRWGEWHTWPNDGSNGTQNWMMSDANANIILDAYDAAFNTTRLENRYPRSGGGTHLTTLASIGFHDDSFAYREMDPALGRVGSMTLPLSMDGKSDAQLTQALVFGSENKWVTASIGGEVRPEVQGQLFGPASATKDDAMIDVEMSHATWMICQNCTYNINDPNEVAVWRKMGYNFYAKNAYFNNTVSGNFKVGVQIENTGVAPFYYGPSMYPVELALKNGSGAIVKRWTTDWDLRTIMPKQVRAFPEWNVPGNPTYVDFGQPQYFDATVNAAGVASGQYSLVMRVVNPLERITEASVRAKGQLPAYLPWYNPLPLLFANTTQGSDGWLGLGSITLQ